MSNNQLQLPYEEITTIANRDYLRENFTRSSREVYKIPFEQLKIRDGFNKRIVYEDMEELAQSIKAHGLKEPLTVDVLPDGRVLIEKGHRRFKAIQMLIEQGEVFDFVECYPNPKTVTELERMTDVYSSNMHSCKLTAIEQAAVVFDLKHNFGKVSNEDIAARLSISRQKVDMLLLIAEAPDDLKEQIKFKTMGMTEACELIRKQKKLEKQTDKAEEDSHKNSAPPTPFPKDELAGEVKELKKLEQEVEVEPYFATISMKWWQGLQPHERASYMAEYFGDDCNMVDNNEISEMYRGVQASQELEKLLEISDEIKVRDNTIRQHIGRKISAPILREWQHDFTNAEGEPESKDMRIELVAKNEILTEDKVSLILDTAEIDTIFVYKVGMEPVAASVITEPVAEKEKDKWDMSRPEIEKIQKAIQAGDKIEAIVSKLDVPEQTKTDLGYQVHWLIENLVFVRDWVHANKKQNKRGS